MRKIKTGVYGLNALMDGGLNENTTTVVIGSPGAGKTTFATHFLKRGMELGEDAIFITLDEIPEQIIKEAEMMGWYNIRDYIEKGKLVFVDAAGMQFSEFIRKQLADFVEEWKGHRARIVIDPLTPVLWSVKEKYEQRELVSFLLRETRKIGTVLCTLEEHGTAGDLAGPELVIPMYLADNVIHLRYRSHDSPERRDFKILKCRSSKHSRFWHPYSIHKGVGIVIHPSELAKKVAGSKKIDLEAMLRERFSEADQDKLADIPNDVLEELYQIIGALTHEDLEHGNLDPAHLIDNILSEYDLK